MPLLLRVKSVTANSVYRKWTRKQEVSEIAKKKKKRKKKKKKKIKTDPEMELRDEVKKTTKQTVPRGGGEVVVSPAMEHFIHEDSFYP